MRAVGQHRIERLVTERRDRRQATRLQGRIVLRQQFADRGGAVAQNKWMNFSCGVKQLAVEQEYPVLDARYDWLDQSRIVIARYFVEVSEQRCFAMDRLREVAARSQQGLCKRGAFERSKIIQRIAALVTRWPVRAMPVVQKEILAAERRNAGAFEDCVRESLVSRERCSGGIVLRIPRAAPGTERDGPLLRANSDEEARASVDLLKLQTEFSTCELCIHGLIRVERRLSSSDVSEIFHKTILASRERGSWLNAQRHLLPCYPQ